MSYSFDMCFWSARTLADALKKAQAVVAAMSDKAIMEKIIEDNLYFVPSLRNHVKPENWRMAMQADENWLYRLFNYRFVYWKEQRLLGMVGVLPEAGPKAMGCVYFQNSCDQDYSLDTWPVKIPFFKNRVEKIRSIMALEPKACLEALNAAGLMDKDVWQEIVDDDGFNSETAEYHALSALYQDIYETLHLNAWLWGKESDAFQRFSFNAIQTIEQMYDLKQYLRNRVVAQAGDFGTKKVVYIPLVLTSQENPSANTLLFKYTSPANETMTCDRAKDIILEVVKRHLKTDDGKHLLAAHGGTLNWMDVFAAVPEKAFLNAGFELVKRDCYSDAVVFDADEQCLTNME